MVMTAVIAVGVFVLVKLFVPVWDLELDWGKTEAFCHPAWDDECGIKIPEVVAVRWGLGGFAVGLRPIWYGDPVFVPPPTYGGKCIEGCG